MSGLPEGWEETTLPDLLSKNGIFTDGDWVESKDQDPMGEVRLVQLADVGDGTFRDKSNRFLNYDAAERLRCTILEEGDVLIARMPDPLGRACRFPGDAKNCATVVDVAVFRSGNDSVSNELVSNFINSPIFRSKIEKLSSGTTRKRISRKNLGSIDFPLPPANEQKRIVKKLTTCEARIEAARQALSEVPKLLEDYRQSVLAAAFRGDLTAKWRAQNPVGEPASKLLERLRHERRQRWEQAELEKYEAKGKAPPKDWKKKYKAPAPLTKEQIDELPELPEGWCWAKLQALVEDGNIFDGPFGSKLKTKDYTVSGVRVVRLENIAPLNFIEDKESYVSEQKYEELKRHEIFEGDIIFSSFIFEPLRVCKIPALMTKALAKADCLCVRPGFPELHPEYLCYALASPITAKAIKGDVHGATRPRINCAQLRAVPIAIPPFQEQLEITRKVARSDKLIDKLGKVSNASDAEITTLTLSLLAKAFRGELVPQDPNDEPASTLLERIAEARQEKSKAKVSSKSENKPASPKLKLKTSNVI